MIKSENSTSAVVSNENQINLLENYPPVLCVKHVAEILVVSHNTAYELVRSGRIHSVRVGRSYRIPLDAVIDYLRKY